MELELALRHPRSADELRHAISSAAEETERLGRLAEDLLLIARADQGQLPMRATTVDVPELLSRAIRGVLCPDGRQLTVDADGVRWLSADPQRLEQALRNLVDNALRHGAGDVSLTAVTVPTGIELHVRDRGAGFPADFLPRAFERFSRADDSRRGGGAGLGLSIVAAVAAAHGGTAGVANPSGGGADVWLTLPHQPPEPTSGVSAS
jgi:signal transduction histidine kinase